MVKMDMSKFFKIFFIIGVCLIIFPANISGELSKFQYDVIELAFTNGFLKGMSIDDEVINELLKDKQKLKDFASKAAREYMDVVEKMNSTGQNDRDKNKGKKEPEATNSFSF